MPEPVIYDHYEVLRRDDGSLWELGRGAMGITYKAIDITLQSTVALKVINAAAMDSEIAHLRFLREARAAASIRHPNVATVFHLGEVDGSYFYVMEFIDGETVDAVISRDGPMPVLEVLTIASQVARALGAAEKLHLVHRDIKPSNIMLVRDDGDLHVKVIDFGLARTLTTAIAEDARTLTIGGFLGTPHFASPEQLDERELDVRSDIYSLGVTMFYMLAGKAPFEGSLAHVISQHIRQKPPLNELPGLPKNVVKLLQKMLAKNPSDRISNPSELRIALEDCLQDSAVSAPGPVNEPLVISKVARQSPSKTLASPTRNLPLPDLSKVITFIVGNPKIAAGIGAGLFFFLIVAISVISRVVGDDDSEPRAPIAEVATLPDLRTGPEPGAADEPPPEPEKPDPAAITLLGRDALTKGDLPGAFQNFRAAAEAGDPAGMSALAAAYARGQGTPQSWPDAIQWFQRASDAGDAYATYALGECYYFGKGVPSNTVTAIGYLAIAANEHDNILAQLLLGDIYRTDELGPPNYAEALALYRSASANGSLDAEAKIGTMIFNGEIIDGQAVDGGARPREADHAAAFEIFSRGAAQQHPLSTYYYAQVLWTGVGAPAKDQNAAREHFLQAARAGEPLAQEWCRENSVEFTDSSTPDPLAPLPLTEQSDADFIGG